jgi:hypothetical protein
MSINEIVPKRCSGGVRKRTTERVKESGRLICPTAVSRSWDAGAGTRGLRTKVRLWAGVGGNPIWAGLCVPILLRGRGIGRRYGVPQTGASGSVKESAGRYGPLG